MATVLTQILDRLDAICRAHVPNGTTVFREDVDPISREESPWLNQRAPQLSVERYSDDFDKHTDTVVVEIGARSAVSPTLMCESVHEAIHRSIVTDATLKGVCDSVRLADVELDPATADQTSCIKRCHYVFTYLIPANSI